MNLKININNVKGSTGQILYAVIILDEDDLAQCSVEHWRGESFDSVGDQLLAEVKWISL